MSVGSVEITAEALALGLVTGLAYGAIGVAATLVFRSTRTINLALGEVGATGAVFLGVAVTTWRWPYWLALPVAIAIAAFVSAAVNAVVIARLQHTPPVVPLIATLGVAQFLFYASAEVAERSDARGLRLQPPGIPPIELGGAPLDPSRVASLLVVPVVIVGTAAFLKKHPVGRAIRAAAANPDLARASGLSPVVLASTAWAIAGALCAIVAILLSPGETGVPQTLGLWLLLRGLAAAFVAGLGNLPWTIACGVAIGVIEHVVSWNARQPEIRDVVLLAVVVLAAIARRSGALGRRGASAWLRLSPSGALRQAIPHQVRRVLPIGALALAAASLAFASPTAATSLTFAFVFAMLGISAAVVTGLLGEISLAHLAVGGFGALASIRVTSEAGNFVAGLAVAAAVAALVGATLGALTTRTNLYGVVVTTLAFATAAETWILDLPGLYGEGLAAGQPVVGDFAFDTARRYGFFALAVLVPVYAGARWLWRSPLGLSLVAQRDNPRTASAFGVAPVRTRLQGHAIAGAVAGVGGATFAHALPFVTAGAFRVTSGIDAIAAAAVGGLGSVAGPLVGALYIAAAPELLPDEAAILATTALGWLAVVVAFPGGFTQVAGLLFGVFDLTPRDEPVKSRGAMPRLLAAPRTARETRHHVLELRGLTRSFGETVALEDVDLAVSDGEVVAVVGHNGAGKTTLLDVICGFEPADAGRVLYQGLDIGGVPPHRRAQLGIARSFEDAALFPTMTVLDAMTLAMSSHPNRSRRRERARELVELMGLGEAAHTRIGQLPTGVRRVADLGCVLALEPQLLLLDEPTSGLAQPEVAELAGALTQLVEHLKLTVVVVDHDLPFVAGVADRVVVLESGRLAGTVPAGGLERRRGR